MRILKVLLPLLLLGTVTLLADYAHVQTSGDVTNDADPGNSSSITVTAGDAYVATWAIFGDAAVTAGCGTPSSNQSDSFETTTNIAFGTTARLCVAAVCNATGGSTVVTVTHGTGGAIIDVLRIDEYSGIADSSCVADTATETESGVTTTTTASVDPAAAALIHGALITNRNPSVVGSGSPTQRWESNSASTLVYNVQDKRAATAGSYTLQWDLDISGVTITVATALTEAGGGGGETPTPLKAIINQGCCRTGAK